MEENFGPATTTFASSISGKNVVDDSSPTIRSIGEATPEHIQEQMMVLQQAFQQKQAELLFHFQQSQSQLALQHFQLSQQLLQDAQRLHQAESSANERELHRINSDSMAVEQPNGDNGLGGFDLSRGAAGGSGAISVHTREKLKALLANKQRSRRRSTQSGSPHFEPYPRPAQNAYDGGAVCGASNDDYDLRKTRSEPNLKVLPSRNALHHHHHHPAAGTIRAKTLTTADMGGDDVQTPPAGGGSVGNINGVGGQHSTPGFFPAPSLPNITAYNRSSLVGGATLPTEPLATGVGGQLFFSMPSWLPYLNAAALQQAAAQTIGWQQQSSAFQQIVKPLEMLLDGSGGSLVEGNRRAPATALQSYSVSQHGLLKQQLRDLVLRRRSLVPEETADDLKSELLSTSTVPKIVSGEDHNTSVGAVKPNKTGLAYDNLLCKHQCSCGDNSRHEEHGGRVQSIWARLQATGLVDQCERVIGRKAPLEFLRLCHGENYTTFFGISPTACMKVDVNDLPLKSFIRLPCGGLGVDSDTYFNDSCTPSAARLAVGCCIELCAAVAENHLRNGFAIVRPPGHHAEPDLALGFCFFNNVAVAAQVLRKKHGIKKVAIVDWDVHHGNGTQLIFEQDPDVLYMSFHRHDDGNFFPGTGAITDVGIGAGRGYTVNVAWSGEPMGDAEYLAAWRVIALPILDHFQPDFVLVSAGFDAANGHRQALGGYRLSSALFGHFTRSLVSRYAEGRVVLVLEGGYDLAIISEAAEQCVRALMDGGTSSSSANMVAPLPKQSLSERANDSAVKTLRRVVEVQKEFWPFLSVDGALMNQVEWASLARQFAGLSVDGVVDGGAAGGVGSLETAADDHRVLDADQFDDDDESDSESKN